MKLIIAGATGFVAKEIIRQCLSRPDITSVVALARKPVTAPEGVDSSKLKSVVVENYGEYSDEVKKELSGANGCIWTVAITPTKSKAYGFDEVRRVCQTWTLAGLEAIHGAGPIEPFRFLYMSGSAAERDQTKKPLLIAEYSLMRGETENKVLEFGRNHEGVEVCVAKPGLINGTGSSRGMVGSMISTAVSSVGLFPSIAVEEIAAAMIDQVVRGFEKEPLLNEDLSRIGKQVLQNKAEAK